MSDLAVAEKKIDPHLISQDEYINNQTFETQKLIITLGTSALVFSVSFLKYLPTSSRFDNGVLIFSWLLLAISVIAGVIHLVVYSWWFKMKILNSWGKEDRYKSPAFKDKIEQFGHIVKVGEFCSFVFFIIAIILLFLFATGEILREVPKRCPSDFKTTANKPK